VRPLFAIGLGALGGLVVGLIVWRYADQQLRAEFAQGGDLLAASLSQGSTQLSAQAQAARTQALAAVGQAIQRDVVPAVRQQVDQSLRSSGITPQLISEVQTALATARRLGVL
jgi:3-oxoacyl-[acyl-carrier-protein] synthase III